MAKENGLRLLTFPPHRSHKLQPLDLGVYGPFKRYYSCLCDSWMSSNPGKPLSISGVDVAELSGQAFQRSFTIENITSAFKFSGIHPCNPDIFTDDVFLPALVTDIPLQRDEHPSDVPSTSLLPESVTSTASPRQLTDEALLATITPNPKVNFAKKRPNKNRFKSTIITDTPEKEKILSRRKKLPKKRPKRTVSSSSDSDISVHLASDDSVSDHESIVDGIGKIPGSPAQTGDQLNIGDFAVIKVFSAEGRHKNFIEKYAWGLTKMVTTRLIL